MDVQLEVIPRASVLLSTLVFALVIFGFNRTWTLH